MTKTARGARCCGLIRWVEVGGAHTSKQLPKSGSGGHRVVVLLMPEVYVECSFAFRTSRLQGRRGLSFFTSAMGLAGEASTWARSLV